MVKLEKRNVPLVGEKSPCHQMGLPSGNRPTRNRKTDYAVEMAGRVARMGRWEMRTDFWLEGLEGRESSEDRPPFPLACLGELKLLTFDVFGCTIDNVFNWRAEWEGDAITQWGHCSLGWDLNSVPSEYEGDAHWLSSVGGNVFKWSLLLPSNLR